MRMTQMGMPMMRKERKYDANDANGSAKKIHKEKRMERIIYKKLSYDIVGACFAVQKKLGRFGREKQFSDELENEFLRREIIFLREYSLSNLTGCDVQGNRVDFLVDEKVIVDVKSKKYITKEDYYQMQRYLKSANMKLGIIVNFRESYLKPKRVLNSDCSVE